MLDMSSIVLSHANLSLGGKSTVLPGSNEGRFPVPPLPSRFYTTGSPNLTLTENSSIEHESEGVEVDSDKSR